MSFLDMPQVDAERVRRDRRPGRARCADVIVPSPLDEPVDRAVAHRARQARGASWWGRWTRTSGSRTSSSRSASEYPQHRHRLPAGARPADGQRARRGDASADSDSVVVLRARGHRRPARDDREGPGAAESGAAASSASSSRCTTSGRRWRGTSATQIQKVFGGKVFKTVITKSVRLEESPAYKESIFTFAPDSTGATEYYSLCEEVIDRV